LWRHPHPPSGIAGAVLVARGFVLVVRGLAAVHPVDILRVGAIEEVVSGPFVSRHKSVASMMEAHPSITSPGEAAEVPALGML